MDAGTYSISSEKSHKAAKAAAAPRPPLQEAGSQPYMPSLSTGSRNPSAKCYVSHLLPSLTLRVIRNIFVGACMRVGCSMIHLTDRSGLFPCWMQGDRFIPDRSAMDMDVAQYLLTEPRKDKENAAAAASPSKEMYRRLLAEKLLNNRTRILAFRNKPPEPENVSATIAASAHHAKPAKQRRHIPQVCAFTDVLRVLFYLYIHAYHLVGW